MVILHVFGKMDRGGAEMRTLDIMKQLSSNGYLFEYCALSGEEGELDSSIRDLGGRIFYLDYRKITFYFQFFKLLKDRKYDVVQSHIHYPSGIILLIAYMAGVKRRIVHYRNISDGTNSNFFRKLRNRFLKILISLFSTNILAVSESSMSHSHHKNWYKDKRCKVILNGVEKRKRVDEEIRIIKEEFLINENERIILHVGRFEEAKNHYQVLRIFKEIHHLVPNSRLILVGKNNTKIGENVKAEIVKLDLESNITLTGVRDDVHQLMYLSDILLFPSLWEGLPGVILEAMATGLYIVASNIDPHIEISRYTPFIDLIDISEDDLFWAEQVVLRLNNLTAKEEIQEYFTKTPFALANNIEELRKIYSS